MTLRILKLALYLIGAIAAFSCVSAIIEYPSRSAWMFGAISILASLTVIAVGVAAGGWAVLDPLSGRRGNG